MSAAPTIESGSALPEVLNPDEALYTAGPVLYDLEVTADPIREPELFGQQVKRANPRYRGDNVPQATRFTLESATGSYHPRVECRVMTAAGGLAMLNREIPFVPGTRLDALLALGAARIATENRTRYAAEAMRDGRVRAGQLAVVTSARPIKDMAEIEAAKLTDEDFRDDERDHPTEHNLGRGAVRVVSHEVPEAGEILHVEVDNARADTEATVRAAIDQLAVLIGGKVGGVTQTFYYAKQGLAMKRAGLAAGVVTAIAGCPSDPAIVAKRTAQTYASEVLSTALEAQELKLAMQQL